MCWKPLIITWPVTNILPFCKKKQKCVNWEHDLQKMSSWIWGILTAINWGFSPIWNVGQYFHKKIIYLFITTNTLCIWKLQILFFVMFFVEKMNPILVTSFLVVFGNEVPKILRNSLFIFHFCLANRKHCKENHGQLKWRSYQKLSYQNMLWAGPNLPFSSKFSLRRK